MKESVKEIIDRFMIERSIVEIETLTGFPVPKDDTRDDLAIAYLQTVERDETILQRKRTIGEIISEAGWIGKVQDTDGLKTFVESVDPTDIEIYFHNKPQRFMLGDNASITVGKGFGKVDSMDLLNFCTKSPGTPFDIRTVNGEKRTISGIQVHPDMEWIRIHIL